MLVVAVRMLHPVRGGGDECILREIEVLLLRIDTRG